MIVDCFTFFNELDLLEIRLQELSPVVDKFVLVEATKTQSLIDKPFYFKENKKRYSEFLHKIIHVTVNESVNNSNNLWNMENFQRNCISRGLEKLSLNDDDWILISDLDEIPNAQLLHDTCVSNQADVFSVGMRFSAYFVNLIGINKGWIGTVATKNKIFKSNNPQFFRSIKDSLPFIENGGWHFSWLGGYEKIYEKAHSCIEPFNKGDIPSKEEFQRYFENFLSKEDKFFIHLENLSQKETQFQKINIDNSFPNFIVNNQKKFEKLIF
jgi:beta-1,4-mannosyl-glycoprotein beta-1,4-N-acetylglucosaminyltransferase